MKSTLRYSKEIPISCDPLARFRADNASSVPFIIERHFVVNAPKPLPPVKLYKAILSTYAKLRETHITDSNKFTMVKNKEGHTNTNDHTITRISVLLFISSLAIDIESSGYRPSRRVQLPILLTICIYSEYVPTTNKTIFSRSVIFFWMFPPRCIRILSGNVRIFGSLAEQNSRRALIKIGT